MAENLGLLLLLYIAIGVATFIARLFSSRFGLASGLVSSIITAFIQLPHANRINSVLLLVDSEDSTKRAVAPAQTV